MARIGLIQMTSGADANACLAEISRQARSLAEAGCDLICTPENALCFGGRKEYHRVAETFKQGPLQSAMAELARELGCLLHLGSFPLRTESGMTTSSLVWNGLGECLGRYDKLHLFDVEVSDAHGQYRESDCFIRGEQPSLIPVPFATLGLSICYDLRFPELFQTLARGGASLLLVPAAFTAVTGRAHWEILLRARAIETQCWVVAIGQTGTHPCGRETWGHSMVVSPWGEVCLDMGQQTGSAWADIDLNQVKELQKRMPLQSHRRFECQLLK